MPEHEITVSCPVPAGFAVDQVRGMFDLKPEKTASETFVVDVPADDELIDGRPWRIGVIVGPSGSGKTTVARDVYGKRFREGGFRWEKAKAVCDQFAGHSMKTVTQTLNAVGFSSPPAWVKPHHVLSGGERFRCDLARALLCSSGPVATRPRGDARGAVATPPVDLVAFDEFTSVVDRTVAKIGSAAIAKSLRKDRFGADKKFVAVTCHYDVLDWLEPDWVLDMSSQQLARGRLRRFPDGRPAIELQVAPVHRGAWELFRRHHYLNTSIQRAAQCFCAFWPQPSGVWEPVAFSAWWRAMIRGNARKAMREHRTVVLPDYQGVGIGNRLSEYCASLYASQGMRVYSTTGHPGMIRYRAASPLWACTRHGHAPSTKTGILAKWCESQGLHANAANSRDRITGGFVYVGPAMDRAQADAMLAARPRPFCLSDAEREALAIARERGGVTAAAVARRTGRSATHALKSLRTLAAEGYLREFRVGRARIAFEPLDS
ncbi:hypothetical protein KOR34_02180 [Posidoniimonas corsicana]|uniref:Uncharacterized protein n=1 Tax=Posidoniimonas corsicana TaxID=1938618 RepID=A0A5C5V9U7_9BACT|nr:winged helix DNA-binding protein [Posidoniimonas corsicana]TWT35328.1 hypothetical protein KOR34_02180 [Posidoniimonas corsicana]